MAALWKSSDIGTDTHIDIQYIIVWEKVVKMLLHLSPTNSNCNFWQIAAQLLKMTAVIWVKVG